MFSTFKYVIYLSILILIFGCDKINRNRTIIIKGSETFQPLLQSLAEKHNKLQSTEIIFKISGGGSQSGLEALLKEEVDLAMSSKELVPNEFDTLLLKGKDIQKTLVAWDKIIIVVNPKNKVSKITIEELKKIYKGEVTNWTNLGGSNDSIHVLSRKEGSGSLSFFKDKVMNGENFASSTIQLSDVNEILSRIKNDTNAIAFVGGGHFNKSVKVLDISKDGIDYFYPSERNVRSNDYPFVIPLFLYHIRNEDKTRLNDFINFVGSRSARFAIMDLGFIPVYIE
jgi:phosphate transport system substrate-binding protein